MFRQRSGAAVAGIVAGILCVFGVSGMLPAQAVTPPRAPMPVTLPIAAAAGLTSPTQVKLSYDTALVSCVYRTMTKDTVGRIVSYGAYCTPKPTTAGSTIISATYSKSPYTWKSYINLAWLSSTSLGLRTSWAALQNQPGKVGVPVRWQPCGPNIVVKVNYGVVAGPNAKRVAEEQALIVAAIASMKARTGLPLVYGGTTSFMPTNAVRFDPKNPTGISMAFATAGVGAGKSNLLPGTATNRGVGGFASWSGNYTAGYNITSGFVVIDNRTLSDPILTGGVYGLREVVYMHELSHAIGLGHATTDMAQVMYPIVKLPYARWGSGDLTGLAKVGRPAGCLTPVSRAASAGISVGKNVSIVD